jgi:hypothetical protein
MMEHTLWVSPGKKIRFYMSLKFKLKDKQILVYYLKKCSASAWPGLAKIMLNKNSILNVKSEVKEE